MAKRRSKAVTILSIRWKAKEGGFGPDEELDDFVCVN